MREEGKGEKKEGGRTPRVRSAKATITSEARGYFPSPGGGPGLPGPEARGRASERRALKRGGGIKGSLCRLEKGSSMVHAQAPIPAKFPAMSSRRPTQNRNCPVRGKVCHITHLQCCAALNRDKTRLCWQKLGKNLHGWVAFANP